MALLIDGTAMAAALREVVRRGVAAFVEETGLRPSLAVVLVGDDPASHAYVARKLKATRETGITSVEHRLPVTISQAELLRLIDALNSDDAISGILVQLPLPQGIEHTAVLDRIDPRKDVDGFHPVNVGRLSIGADTLLPCTPMGCMMLLESVIEDFRGMTAVVIGKSNIVGKPIALLLLERGATVTVTHILSRDIAQIVRGADIVVAAAGAPGLVRGDWVKPGAVVIDVGINRITEPDGTRRLVGDVETSELAHAAAVTPVPGGVGPMTVACLVANTLDAALRRSKRSQSDRNDGDCMA